MSIAISTLGARGVLRINRDEHTTTVAADKCLIPQGKHVPANRCAIFMILSIKNIHPKDYVSSLTVQESAAYYVDGHVY